MAFGRKKNEPTTSASPSTTGRLPATMPTRLPEGDNRGDGHETTYQSSRGGWLRKG
ncbi:hypothetical protein [Streptomyces sp. NPDC059783]|uniref:hypothetical protein n=1 Tax=Streptomyces sp. NPDC059783 TaxID=3346944 RepID=UPI003666B384